MRETEFIEAFLEEGGLEKQHQAEVWLKKMSAGYSVSPTSIILSRFQVIKFILSRPDNLDLSLLGVAQCAQQTESCL